MKILLHIGTDKTGSTAIQKHLYLNREWLRARGVFIPQTGLGKDNGHATLLATMNNAPMACLKEELTLAASAGLDTAVISWEGMCFLSAGQIARLAKYLPIDHCWLVVYLREQADIIQTGYLQSIKTHKSVVRFADFQGPARNRSSLHALLLCYSRTRNYARLLKKWMRFIQKGQVIVREFQPDLLLHGSVVDDFLSALGLTADDQFLRITSNTNISFDVESATILNTIDATGPSEDARKSYVYSLLSLIDSDGAGSRHFLSTKRVESIRRFYRKSNNAIGDIVGAPVSKLFFNPPNCVARHTDVQMLESVNQKKDRLQSLMQTPMLFSTRTPHRVPETNVLTSGWEAHQVWGAWSSGAESKMQFRVPFWMLSHERAHVVIFLKGRYCGQHTRSHLIINNSDYGWCDLREFSRAIALPVTCLYPNQRIEIRIIHEIVGSSIAPRIDEESKEVATRSFGIERLGIQFSNPD